MKKLFLLFLLAGMLAGCGVIQTEELPDSAVIPDFTQYFVSTADGTAYLVDNRTGVVYIRFNRGLTIMLNPDGPPVTKEQIGLK